MRILLDTHIFLWYITSDRQLTPHLSNQIQDATNQVFLSVVSIWEATIKFQLGKLPLPEPPAEYLSRQRVQHQILSLPIEEQSIAYLNNLPPMHRDPFDRMLICQALAYDLTIATIDSQIVQYNVPILE